MHQTRQSISKLMPLPRKGTKYVARALVNPKLAVPLVIAVRDILRLAKTAKEVREMIKSKSLKINGRVVYGFNDSIQLLQILEAGKTYQLDLLPTGKFTLVEVKSDTRTCKVMNKTLLPGNKIQFNLHDGSNVISKDNIAVGDTLQLSFDGKIKKHISLEKGKDVLIFKGKYAGKRTKVKEVSGSLVSVIIGEKETMVPKNQVIAV